MPDPNVLGSTFYSTDLGRLGPYGNQTGQPASMEGGREPMYPSNARTQLVPNPIFREGGPLPQYIPADMAQILAKLLRK